MKTPLVSILIPTYNRAAYLPDAIASVRAQSFPDWELIIVDDKSDDDTPIILHTIAAEEPRMRVIRHAGKLHGPAPARNAGLRIARGEWIAMLDSDDCWMPDALASHLAQIGNDVVLSGGDVILTGKDDANNSSRKFIQNTMVPWWTRHPLAEKVIDWNRLLSEPQHAMTDPDMLVAMALGGFLWPHCSSSMIRRRDMLACGGFDERLLRTEDWVLWLQLLRRGRFVFIDRILAEYDTTGRDDGSGNRYASFQPDRRHDAYIEHFFHLKFLEHLPYRARLWPEAYAFLNHRMSVYHQRCRRSAGPERRRAALWHALAGWGSPEN